MKDPKATIFVGYDDRESDFYNLCEYSIKNSSPYPVEVIPIKHKELRDQGLFTREWKIDKTGQYYDVLDKKPFSTQFSHTRFLVPEMARRMGKESGLVMFVDCDFIFLDDVTKIFADLHDRMKDSPVACVKHNYIPKKDIKMDGMKQATYNYKLWSSLMVFNLDHPDVKNNLTAAAVNKLPGSYFHQFRWVTEERDFMSDTLDRLLGTAPDGFDREKKIIHIDERWNFIPDHSEERVSPKNIGAIHYTMGGPALKGYEDCSYSELYYETEKNYKYDSFLETARNVTIMPRK